MPLFATVLARVARREGVDVASMYLEGDTVFYNSGDGLRTACQIGTAYWLEIWSEVTAEALIARCARPLQRKRRKAGYDPL